MWNTRNNVNKHFWSGDQLTTRLVHAPSSKKECPIMKPVASCGRLLTVNGTSPARETSHKVLWKGRRCSSLILMETERKEERKEGEGRMGRLYDYTVFSLPLFFFHWAGTQPAQQSHSNMLSNGSIVACEIPHLWPDCATASFRRAREHLLAHSDLGGQVLLWRNKKWAAP